MKKLIETQGRGVVYNSILETIGNTPLVKLPRLTKHFNVKANVLAKLEFFNPMASVKDRLGIAMVEQAEEEGKLNQDSVIVEPTSGNTGIALAFIAAAKGYPLILTMPESMSMERRKMLEFLGAKIELTPAERGMSGAIERANEIVEKQKNAVILQQFENPANPEIHRRTTANEIWNDTNGSIDVLISGVGTGGTLTGAGEVLKELKPDLKIIAIEPEDSAILSGGGPGPHKIQGIGAGFIPKILNVDLIDEVITIGNETAFEISRLAAKIEGIPGGISSGAALAAAFEVAERENMKGKTIVTIIPSFAERYLSTALFDL